MRILTLLLDITQGINFTCVRIVSTLSRRLFLDIDITLAADLIGCTSLPVTAGYICLCTISLTLCANINNIILKRKTIRRQWQSNRFLKDWQSGKKPTMGKQ